MIVEAEVSLACLNTEFKPTAIPDDLKEKSVHAFRDMLIGKAFPKIRSKFTQLRLMSQSARYLETSSGKCGFDYITSATADRALADLEYIKKEVDAR